MAGEIKTLIEVLNEVTKRLDNEIEPELEKERAGYDISNLTNDLIKLVECKDNSDTKVVNENLKGINDYLFKALRVAIKYNIYLAEASYE